MTNAISACLLLQPPALPSELMELSLLWQLVVLSNVLRVLLNLVLCDLTAQFGVFNFIFFFWSPVYADLICRTLTLGTGGDRDLACSLGNHI